MSNIPVARGRLLAIAKALEEGDITKEEAASSIRDCVEFELHREPPIKRVHTQSPHVSQQMKEAIIAFVEMNPDMPQALVAAHFKINLGRVSETLNGL